MAERTIPILPCRSIDEVLAFYAALGFEVTYRQERPNTFAAIVRGGIELQFFVLKLEPEANYSTCYVLVDAVDELYAAFTEGIRAAIGRLPTRGFPRIGALRDMSYGVRQFIVVDPAGNHIRIGEPIEARPALRAETAGRLERSLVAAITLADSKQDPAAAAAVLDAAMDADSDAPPVVRVRAQLIRVDLAYRLERSDEAARWLEQASAAKAGLDPTDAQLLADDWRRAEEIRVALDEDAVRPV
jgi:catechol 2,3-dioxygenase-like lactoylglutathione lyase family enzyme